MPKRNVDTNVRKLQNNLVDAVHIAVGLEDAVEPHLRNQGKSNRREWFPRSNMVQMRLLPARLCSWEFLKRAAAGMVKTQSVISLKVNILERKDHHPLAVVSQAE